jgi:hypothetical protein
MITHAPAVTTLFTGGRACARRVPGRERLAEVLPVGILVRDHEALPLLQLLPERLALGREVPDPLAHLADLLPGGQDQFLVLGVAGGGGFAERRGSIRWPGWRLHSSVSAATAKWRAFAAYW